MSNENPLVADIERLVLAAQKPADVDSTPVVILNQGQSVADLSKYLDNPPRKKAHAIFSQCDSFIRYVNEHKDPFTRIYVPDALHVNAIIDHNGPATFDPGWGEHRADYAMQHSLEWATWTNANKSKMTQKDFCEFVEDNAKDFSDRTNMLELVRTLQINSNVAFNSWEKGDNGNVMLSFQKIVQARAGEKGEVDLPPTFQISIPCFMGGIMLPMQAKLRFEISESDKKLKLWYELQKVQQLVQEHTKKVVEHVAKATGIEPFYGIFA